MKVTQLHVGDLVADEHGEIGKIVGFRVDGALIEWNGGVRCHGDADLHGVDLVDEGREQAGAPRT